MGFFKTSLFLAALTALFMGAGYLLGGASGAAIALVIAAGMNLYAFWSSDKVALRMHNAEPVSRASAPDLHGMVEELARNADLPTPKVFLIRTDQPNAFAAGRSPSNASVAVTTGLMQMLKREELAGVIAHELAHIKNRDTLIMTVAATIAGALSMLAQFGLYFGGGRDRNPLGFIGVLLTVILAPIAAMMVQMLISRTREYAADKLGAQICRNPLWLAAALAKISGGARRHEMESAEANPASAHLFIINPLSGRRMDNLFSTHPDTQNRIDALYEMAGSGYDSAPAVRHAHGVVARRGDPNLRASRSVNSSRERRGPWEDDGRDKDSTGPSVRKRRGPWG